MKRKFLGIIFALTAAVSLSACKSDDKNVTPTPSPQNTDTSYIMEFEGEKVSYEEFYNYTKMQKVQFEDYYGGDYIWSAAEDAFETAKEYAVNYLLQSKLIALNAAKLGVTLTSEEKQEARTTAAKYREDYLAEVGVEYAISENELTLVIEENTLTDKLFELVTKDFVLDEELLAQSYTEYLEFGKSDYIDILVTYVITDSEAAATEARQKIISGEDMKTVIKDYSLDYNAEESDEYNFGLVDLAELNFMEEETFNALYEMSEGTVTDIILVDETYYLVIKIEECTEPDYDLLKEQHKESYIYNEKSNIFDEEFSAWYYGVTFTINEAAFDKLLLSDF